MAVYRLCQCWGVKNSLAFPASSLPPVLKYRLSLIPLPVILAMTKSLGGKERL